MKSDLQDVILLQVKIDVHYAIYTQYIDNMVKHLNKKDYLNAVIQMILICDEFNVDWWFDQEKELFGFERKMVQNVDSKIFIPQQFARRYQRLDHSG
jgi:hypothetical protein